MNFIISILQGIVDLLPDGLLYSWLEDNGTIIDPIYHTMNTVNYFIPIYLLVDLFTGWVALMIISILLFLILRAVL